MSNRISVLYIAFLGFLFLLGCEASFLSSEALAAKPTRPVAPTLLAASALSSSQVLLSWRDNSSNETGFRVNRATSSAGPFTQIASLGVNVTSYTNTGLNSGTTYFYQVSAYNSRGSAASSIMSATTSTVAPPTDVTAPTLSVNSPSTGQVFSSSSITVSGTASDSSGILRVMINGVQATGTTSFSKTHTLNPGANSITVVAYDNSSAQNQTTKTINVTYNAPDAIAPSVPGTLAATSISTSQINLSWNASTDTGGSGLKGYNIYRNATFLKQVPAPTVTASDTGLTASTNYSYQVSSIDNSGNESAKTLAVTATTLAAADATAPTLSVTSPTEGQIFSSSSITVTGTASDASAILKVTVNGALAAGTSNFTKTHTLNLGANAITIVAFDNSVYQHQTTKVINVMYNTGDTTVPTVALTSPFNDSIVSGTIRVSATASDNIGVTKVDFYRDTIFLMSDTAYPYIASDDTTKLTNGDHTFLAKAFDAAGNTSSSSSTARVNNLPAYVGQANWAKDHIAYSVPNSAVGVDASRNVINAGCFEGSINFGSGHVVSAGSLDSFIAKYTEQGTLIWSKTLGSVGADRIYDMVVDGQGNIIVTGYFTKTVDFGGVILKDYDPYNANQPDIFVAKYFSNGTLDWVKQFGGSSYDEGKAVAVDAAGNIILAAGFVGSVNFGGGITLASAGSTDIALVKLSAAGTTLWAVRYGGSYDDYVKVLAVDQRNGDIVINGQVHGPTDLGAGTQGNGGHFLSKYSGANGDYIWAKLMSDASINAANIDPKTGNVFMTGGTSGSIDFGGGAINTPTYGNGGLYVAAYDPDGNYLWAKVYGQSGDKGMAVVVGPNGTLAVTGSADGSMDFNKTAVYISGHGYILANFTTAGDYRWSRRASGYSWGSGAAFDSAGHILVTGTFQGTVDFGGISKTAGGINDGFLVQYND